MNKKNKKLGSKRNRITIGEFRTPPRTQKYLINDQNTPSKRSIAQRFSIDSQDSPIPVTRRHSSFSVAPIPDSQDLHRPRVSIDPQDSPHKSQSSSRRHILVDSAASPGSTKRRYSDMPSSLKEQKSPIPRRQRVSIDPIMVENYHDDDNVNSALQISRMLIDTIHSPQRSQASIRRQILIGSQASPDPFEREMPDSPTTQHKGLHGSLDILHKIQGMRQTQARLKINVDPKNVTFICGINRFSDDDYDYMLRVNDGKMNLSMLSIPTQLQLYSFDVSPISSFNHPVLLANVIYDETSVQW